MTGGLMLPLGRLPETVHSEKGRHEVSSFTEVQDHLKKHYFEKWLRAWERLCWCGPTEWNKTVSRWGRSQSRFSGWQVNMRRLTMFTSCRNERNSIIFYSVKLLFLFLNESFLFRTNMRFMKQGYISLTAGLMLVLLKHVSIIETWTGPVFIINPKSCYRFLLLLHLFAKIHIS